MMYMVCYIISYVRCDSVFTKLDLPVFLSPVENAMVYSVLVTHLLGSAGWLPAVASCIAQHRAWLDVSTACYMIILWHNC